MAPSRVFDVGKYYSISLRSYNREEAAMAAERSRVTDPLQIRDLAERYRSLPLLPEFFKLPKAGAIGIELEFAGVCENRRDIPTPFWARLGTDISVHAPSGYRDLELRALATNKTLEKRVLRMCEIMLQLRARLTERCSLHVHLDARHMDESEAASAARRLLRWLILLQELVPLNRRQNEFCRLESNVNQVLGEADYEEYSSRYCAVNFYAYQKFKSLEIRLHSGTLEPVKIVQWIKLMQKCLVTPAPRRGPDTDVFSMLLRLELPKPQFKYWIKRHQELNPKLYEGSPGVEKDSEVVDYPSPASPSAWPIFDEPLATYRAEQMRVGRRLRAVEASRVQPVQQSEPDDVPEPPVQQDEPLSDMPTGTLTAGMAVTNTSDSWYYGAIAAPSTTGSQLRVGASIVVPPEDVELFTVDEEPPSQPQPQPQRERPETHV